MNISMGMRWMTVVMLAVAGCGLDGGGHAVSPRAPSRPGEASPLDCSGGAGNPLRLGCPPAEMLLPQSSVAVHGICAGSTVCEDGRCEDTVLRQRSTEPWSLVSLLASRDGIHAVLHTHFFGGAEGVRHLVTDASGEQREDRLLPTARVDQSTLFGDVLVASSGTRHFATVPGVAAPLWDIDIGSSSGGMDDCAGAAVGAIVGATDNVFVRALRCADGTSQILWFGVRSGTLVQRVAVELEIATVIADETGALYASGHDRTGASVSFCLETDGRTRWSDFGSASSQVRAVWRDAVFLSDGRALDRVTGRRLRTFEIPSTAKEVLVTDDRVTFLGRVAEEHFVSTFSPEGAHRWTRMISDDGRWLSSTGLSTDGRLVFVGNRYSYDWNGWETWLGTDLIELDARGNRNDCALPVQADRAALVGGSLAVTHSRAYNMGTVHSFTIFDLPTGVSAATSGWVNARGDGAGSSRPAAGTDH